MGRLESGKLDVTLDGQTASIGAKRSWLIPAGVNHRYQITEIEATSPSA